MNGALFLQMFFSAKKEKEREEGGGGVSQYAKMCD